MLSGSVRRFITDYIDSVELLEVLLLVKSQLGRSWMAQEISEELRTSLESAEKRLKTLCRSHILKCEKTLYIYKPHNPDLHKIVDEVEKAYKERRFSIIELIFSKPMDRIQTLADAFELRKEKDEDG